MKKVFVIIVMLVCGFALAGPQSFPKERDENVQSKKTKNAAQWFLNNKTYILNHLSATTASNQVAAIDNLAQAKTYLLKQRKKDQELFKHMLRVLQVLWRAQDF